MTSPVDTTVKYFDSLMPNAPVLNGVAGSLIGLLDACLKDGFNTVTLTSLVVASNVATATFTGTHAASKDLVVLIAGATGGPTGFAGLNGEQKVTAKPGTTSITFATSGIADGTATGTITMKMAPAGFSKAFSGTNLAAYQSNDPASTKCLLRIDDTATTFVRVVGYEQMTDINTGVGQFPTTAQISGGGYWAKSQAANTNAVQWSLISDGRVFYLNIQSGSGSSVNNQITAGRMFGDCISLKPGGDAYACTLNYSGSSAVSAMSEATTGSANSQLFATPREYTGLGSASLTWLFAYGSNGAVHSGITAVAGAFPNPVDGSLILMPKHIAAATTGTATPRAQLAGLYHAQQSNVWNSYRLGDKVPGAGPLAGRTLAAATSSDSATSLANASTVANTGILFFDITGPWR